MIKFVCYSGDYDVNILFDGQHIPGSPFKVLASEPVDVSKVKVTGPGVGKTVPASFPVSFTVDATKTGKAPCTVEVVGPKDEVYPCEVIDNGDKTFKCTYTPKRKGKTLVDVLHFLPSAVAKLLLLFFIELLSYLCY